VSEPRWLEGDDFALCEDELCEECEDDDDDCACGEDDPDAWRDALYED
jgi:hypothetical protein